jgi:hypothetical protein
MNTIETIEYGDVMNSTLLKIFGDEMTYNELKFYAKNEDEATHLKVEFNRNTETQLVRVWFDDKVVMDKKYCIHHSCDMFIFLNEIDYCDECGSTTEVKFHKGEDRDLCGKCYEEFNQSFIYSDDEEEEEEEEPERDDITDIIPVIYLTKEFRALKLTYDKVIKELKQGKFFKKEGNRLFGFIRLELKEYLKKYTNDQKIVYQGNMYEYRYIHRCNEKHRHNTNISKYGEGLYAEPMMFEHYSAIYKRVIKADQQVEVITPKELAKYSYQLREANRQSNEQFKDVFKLKPFKDFNIKVRVKIGKMDLKKTPRQYYNPLNLKWWDKTTKKTSNKGLKADTTYSWSYGSGERGGWVFGGLTADDMEKFAMRNGFKFEKGEKYYYGHFAEWFLHTLE